MRTPDVRRLLDYLDWANEATLAGTARLPDDVLRADVGISFRSIHGTLRHMLWAERLWFERWARGADPGGYEAPSEPAALVDAWRALAEERRAWSAALPDDAPERDCVYRHFRDGEQRANLGDLVTHAVTHAALHRGQVVGMMRQAGVAPPATGMLSFVREGR